MNAATGLRVWMMTAACCAAVTTQAADSAAPARRPAAQRPAAGEQPQGPAQGPLSTGRPEAAAPRTQREPRVAQNPNYTPIPPVTIERRPQGAGPGQNPLQQQLPQLTPEEQQRVDKILRDWEAQQRKIKTFACEFTRLEYDNAGTGAAAVLIRQAEGEIKYKTPDHGVLKVKRLWDVENGALTERFFKPDAEGKLIPVPGWDHWVCDGKSVYTFDHANRQLKENKLDPSLQGEAMREHGPVPFIFGSTADGVLRRFVVKEVPSQDGGIWLQAFPRHLIDAQEFRRVDLILNATTHMPEALQIHHLGGARTSFQFPAASVKINALLANFDSEFGSPTLPALNSLVDKRYRWTRVVEGVNDGKTPAPGGNAGGELGAPGAGFGPPANGASTSPTQAGKQSPIPSKRR